MCIILEEEVPWFLSWLLIENILKSCCKDELLELDDLRVDPLAVCFPHVAVVNWQWFAGY